MWLLCLVYAVTVPYFAARICVGDYVNVPCFVLYLVAVGAIVGDFLVEEIRRAYHDCTR